MRREANPGNTERGRAGHRGECRGNVRGARGAAVAAPSGRCGGLGHGGGRKGGRLPRGSGGRGALRPWGGGMVAGGDGNTQGQLAMAGGAYGLESNRSGRRWGPGAPSKCRHKRGCTGGGGALGGGWNLPARVRGCCERGGKAQMSEVKAGMCSGGVKGSKQVERAAAGAHMLCGDAQKMRCLTTTAALKKRRCRRRTAPRDRTPVPGG